MPKSDLCEIVVLLDRSGSMASIKKDMEGGFDSFVAEQRKEPGECVLTLVQFDSDGIDTIHEAKPLANVPPMKLDPRGSTPLLDAMGQTIRRTGERFAKMAEASRPARVLFMVITDGQENASKEFKKDAIKAMVEEQANVWKWQFSFLGANVDAFGEAAALGIAASASSNYAPNAAGVNQLFASTSRSASVYRSGGTFQMPPSAP